MKNYRSFVTLIGGFILLSGLLNLMGSCKKGDDNPPSPPPTKPKDSTKIITSFSVKGPNGAVLDIADMSVSIKADSILVGVPFGTDLSHLTPSLTFSGVILTPASGEEQDFTKPVVYTVQAEDTSKRKYVVVVTRMPIRNRVFVGGDNNKFYALDALTGALKWDFTSTKPFSYSTATFKDSVVYVGGIDNYVYAFHAVTGKILWKFLTGSTGIEAPVTLDDKTIYVGCNDAIFYALDAQTGAEKWRYNTHGNISTGATVVNGIVYFGCSDSKEYALNAKTGQFVWSYTTGDMLNGSGQAVVDGKVYFGSRDGYLYAVNATDGGLVWKYSAGFSLEQSSPTVANGVVYIAGWVGGSLYAVNASTGTLIWESLKKIGFSSSPTVSNGLLYISGDDGNFYAVNTSNGTPAWSKNIYPNSGNATVADGVVYNSGGGYLGYFHAYNAITGADKWQFDTKNTALSFSGALVLDSQGRTHYAGKSGMEQ
ncbi:MAG: PQQ-binding-like beta-propeller repeat protein [Niastella sp.]|uniref:outer membrane protein assembly factor BamB family protein n=1 Tax=Niastella sp. TaxID=1869183 RepID=UPI00389A15B4